MIYYNISITLLFSYTPSSCSLFSPLPVSISLPHIPSAFLLFPYLSIFHFFSSLQEIFRIGRKKGKERILNLFSPDSKYFWLKKRNKYVLQNISKDSCNIFQKINAEFLIKGLLLSFYILYFLLVLVFYSTSIGDLSSLDIILPSLDDGSLELNLYNVDILSN